MLQLHKVAIALPQIQPEFLELHAFGGLESSDTGTLMLPPPYVSSPVSYTHLTLPTN